MLELFHKVRLFIKNYYVRFRNEIQKYGLFLFDILYNNRLFFLEIVAIQKINMICPKANLHRFKSISYYQSHNISLFLKCVRILVSYFILNLLNNSNYIDHLTLYPLIFVLPSIILVFVLRLDDFVLNFLNFVILLFQSNLRSSF